MGFEPVFIGLKWIEMLESTAHKLKSRTSVRFLCASLTFGSGISLQDLGMRENMDFGPHFVTIF